MNKKKWIVVAFALILLIASAFANKNKATMEDFLNQKQSAQLTGLLNNEPVYEEKVREEGSSEQRILVIPIEGAIGPTNVSYNHELILDTIEQIRTDETIKAVLLEIDSPGGAVYHTREAYDLFKEVLAEHDIPVYASMGSMAASGGYYYAMLADKVYASPETITGSIGVIASSMNVEELYKKIGVKPQVFKSGDLKDIGSGTREMTDEEKKVMQGYIDEAFNRFVQVVTEGREMSEERVRELADGRIYTGTQAKENGLIDDLAYYRDVVEIIREENNLADAQVFEKIESYSNFNNFFPTGFMESETPDYAEQFDKILNRVEEETTPHLEYRWEGGL